MKAFLVHAIENWKTTASGICSFAVITCGYITGYLALHPTPGSLGLKVFTIATFTSGLAKVYILAISTDAGKTPALVPGSPVVQMVPSHEEPNDPAATPVVPAAKVGK